MHDARWQIDNSVSQKVPGAGSPDELRIAGLRLWQSGLERVAQGTADEPTMSQRKPIVRSDRPMTPIQSILPSIGLTKRMLRKLDAISVTREHRHSGKQEIAFQARPFVLCGIPLRRPPLDQLAYRRRNGKFSLEITGHPRYGLPTVRADCTCAPLAFGMGGNFSSLSPAA